MEERRDVKTPLENYDIEFLLQDGKKTTYPTIYNDALFQVLIIILTYIFFEFFVFLLIEFYEIPLRLLIRI